MTSEHPVTYLYYLADKGQIKRPVYVGEPQDGQYHMVIEIPGHGHAVVSAPTRSEAKRLAAQAMLDRIKSKVCPTPQKRRYATAEAAYEALVKAQILGRTDKPLEQAYACRCDWWHLSSSTWTKGVPLEDSR